MKTENFILAKKLNELYHEQLLKISAHFRGNVNSCSLISLDSKTPEKGVSNVTEENAKKILETFNPEAPKRLTPEKELQAWIINYAIRNDNKLPFGEWLQFITSEFAASTKGQKVVNDILAIDQSNNLVVIELKSKRTTDVMNQAQIFAKFIAEEDVFFRELTTLLTGKAWCGKVRCIAIWPHSNGVTRAKNEKYHDVEVIGYLDNYSFYPENQ